MRVTVFGVGAVGGLLAGRLSAAGHPVDLVAREPRLSAIRANGLTLTGHTVGTYRLPIAAAPGTAGRPEVVIVAVKGPELASAGALLARTCRPLPPILAIQNGLGVEEALAEGIVSAGGDPDRPGQITRGILTLGATDIAPGVVRHAGVGGLRIGPRGPAPAALEAARRFAELFRSAGIPVEEVAEVDREVWRKLLLNAAVNPVTADHGIPNGRLAQDPYRGQALALLREAVSVARAEGYDLSEEEVEAELWRVVRSTAENRSSMLQDLDRGRPTEIETISGALLARGRAHGLALPATERALDRLRARAARARSAGPTP